MANIDFQTKIVTGQTENTLSQRVYSLLCDEIVNGELVPGERLTRRGLSKRLGVSQNPVTEALMRLERDGFVENKPLYGCRVRVLTIEDVENDQILREAIECQLVRLCCEYACNSDLAALMMRAAELDRITTQGDPESRLGMRLHLEFHMLIGEFGKKCPYLVNELERVWLRSLMRLNWVKSALFCALPEDWHQQLVEVIKDRNPDAAEAKMRKHVKMNEQYDIKTLEFLNR
ncbi:putative HTH-type transcriptional regulator YdfH [Limihaloglobus sulfuriphilus]|uniref:Putative HTH-type transcriptional regulator YdfH n=1 Tax=Limihaloglobus sulfuriphilus TaxID=1851148 RepID=A0A1Q2MBK8_9BACT|nr:GntR family transcriptional regulator [Limihaloglobus sulfuriphilus]AQQ70086.1 putative HTH-type transcriptional regulator YdfH [Limihaloglobus sulfuriphilus]